jgi:hypothetical protein
VLCKPLILAIAISRKLLFQRSLAPEKPTCKIGNVLVAIALTRVNPSNDDTPVPQDETCVVPPR